MSTAKYSQPTDEWFSFAASHDDEHELPLHVVLLPELPGPLSPPLPPPGSRLVAPHAASKTIETSALPVRMRAS
jgi:hypothetical protein